MNIENFNECKETNLKFKNSLKKFAKRIENLKETECPDY